MSERHRAVTDPIGQSDTLTGVQVILERSKLDYSNRIMLPGPRTQAGNLRLYVT